jgi:hypothetical protein
LNDVLANTISNTPEARGRNFFVTRIFDSVPNLPTGSPLGFFPGFYHPTPSYYITNPILPSIEITGFPIPGINEITIEQGIDFNVTEYTAPDPMNIIKSAFHVSYFGYVSNCNKTFPLMFGPFA